MSMHGNLGKLCHIPSAKLIIQQTHMVNLGYYRKLLCHEKICMGCLLILLLILVKRRFNEILVSVELS